MREFLFYFGIPYGAVWSNVFAAPICASLAFGAAYLFRDTIGRKLVGFFHKHHAAHLARLERENDKQLPNDV